MWLNWKVSGYLILKKNVLNETDIYYIPMYNE